MIMLGPVVQQFFPIFPLSVKNGVTTTHTNAAGLHTLLSGSLLHRRKFVTGSYMANFVHLDVGANRNANQKQWSTKK